MTSYASREDADPTRRPQLLLMSVAPPQFTNVVWSVGGGFSVFGTGPAGQGYRIFTATNLAVPFSNWTPTATGTFSGGVFSFTDLQATNFSRRFYRTVTP